MLRCGTPTGQLSESNPRVSICSDRKRFGCRPLGLEFLTGRSESLMWQIDLKLHLAARDIIL